MLRIRRQDDGVRVGGLDLGDVRQELQLAGLEELRADDLSARALDRFRIRAHHGAAPVVVDYQEREAFALDRRRQLAAEGCAHHRRGGDGAEEVGIVLLGKLRGGRDARHVRDLVLARHFHHRGGGRAAERPEQRDHLVARHELFRRVHRLRRVAGAVLDDQLDLPAEHAALGVHVVDQHPHRAGVDGTVVGHRTGKRLHHADLHGFLGGGGLSEGECNCSDAEFQLHGVSLEVFEIKRSRINASSGRTPACAAAMRARPPGAALRAAPAVLRSARRAARPRRPRCRI